MSTEDLRRRRRRADDGSGNEDSESDDEAIVGKDHDDEEEEGVSEAHHQGACSLYCVKQSHHILYVKLIDLNLPSE